jgi:hypothetical protein
VILEECVVRVVLSGKFVFKLVVFALLIGTLAGVILTH